MLRSEISEKFHKSPNPDYHLAAAVVESFDGDERYIVRDLTEREPLQESEFVNQQDSLPVQWFGLLTNSRAQHSLRVLQFGENDNSPATINAAMQLTKELIFINGDRVTTEQYNTYGGLVVDAVQKEGHEVFAALEINKIVIEGEGLLFAKLAISKVLRNSAALYVESVKEKSYLKLPEWGKSIVASLPDEEWLVAESLAWSALASPSGPKV